MATLYLIKIADKVIDIVDRGLSYSLTAHKKKPQPKH